MRLLARILAAVLLLTPFALLSGSPARAAACPSGTGVTVVVQYGSTVDVRCAPGDPATGWSALTAAGFGVTRVQQQPGFVCRITINGQPEPSTDPCTRTPPTSAYWTYWHATPGGSWVYSTWGAAAPQSNPAPGTFQGWRFGSGQPPAWSVPAPKPSPTTTKRPTSTTKRPTSTTRRPSATSRPTSTPRRTPSATSSPRSTGSSNPASSRSGAASASSSSSSKASKSSSSSKASKSSSSSKASTSSSSSEASMSSASSSAPASAAAAPPGADETAEGAQSADQTSGGSMTPVIVGLALVLLLGGAAAVISARRRRT